jgi:hypothetical protein
MAKKTRTAEEFRGQLMLQISAGRFFRPGVPINEHAHRRTIYSNASLLESVDLPVGKLITSTDIGGDIWTAMLEAVDRLEAQRWDGTDDFMIATDGDNLIDDIAYVMTFALNRTFTRDRDQIHRLVPTTGNGRPTRGAANLFPQLFTPMEVIRPTELDDLTRFMSGLIEMPREDFARVMRVIRTTVDATRRAVDDPTGAYTDLVAALESLAEDANTTATTWDRYDPKKRKIIDTALQDASDDIGERLRAAVLEADRVGLKRRFVSGTVSRIAPEYFRTGAVGAIRPPRSAEIERMLAIAYDIRSKRSHVLTDLGEEAWVYTDGAETAFEPNFQRIFTLAGLWRLVRHVVRSYIIGATNTLAEPWDYREALPGIIKMQLAPQYWVWQPEGLTAESAVHRFNGVAEAFIGWQAGHHDDGFNLTHVVEKAEQLVPHMLDGEAKTAVIAIHLLWHEWTDPATHRSESRAFLDEYSS